MPEEGSGSLDTKNEILEDIKAICGITSASTDFDTQIVIHANSVISSLRQLGELSGSLYKISKDEPDKWDDLESDPEIQPLIVEYVCLRTKLSFDPPQSTSVETAYSGRIDELEFRIGVLTDPREEE